MSTTGKNFVKFTATVANATVPIVEALGPNQAASQAAASSGTLLDKFTADLSSAGYVKNGAFFLGLAASTPITIDLTAAAAAASAAAGDTTFATINELIFNNPSTADVVVTPGGSNPFNGALGGTAPSFTVPAGAKLRWQSPAGWPVTITIRTLTFSSGSAVGSIGVSVGGS